MRFRVIGAERRTGRDVVRVYESATREAATAAAVDDGIVVAATQTLVAEPTIAPPEPPADAPASAAHGTSEPAPSPAAPTVSASEESTSAGSDPGEPTPAPPEPARRPPKYGGLRLAGRVLRLYAIVCYLFGGVAVVGAGAITVESRSGSAAALELAFTLGRALLPALVFLFAAAVTHGLSAICLAMRDVARSNWR